LAHRANAPSVLTVLTVRCLRRGVTLIELIVALVVGGVALALVATIAVRQQRLYADIADRAALAGQLRQAVSILPIDLRGASSTAGDIREARDTSIELRATIASAVVCDTAAGSLILAPAVSGETTFGSYLTPIATGDTAWIFAPGDTADRWIAYDIGSSIVSGAGPCAPTGPQMNAPALASRRISVRLNASSPIAGFVGTVVRVTRPIRYSLYRGGDSRWYLGQRDWNATSLRFNGVQPVSGPFASPASRGIVFQYYDTLGAELVVPVADTRAIALVRVDVRGQSRNAMRAFSARPQAKSSDSAQLAVLLRNRR
jgi:prepilin-type N-terminal cleavage/methylation domain-containing protein